MSQTKVKIIGSQKSPPKKPKAIEFVKLVGEDELYATEAKPSDFKNVELIALNYSERYDLMFAYDTDRSEGCAFLGHFNDGIVE